MSTSLETDIYDGAFILYLHGGYTHAMITDLYGDNAGGGEEDSRDASHTGPSESPEEAVKAETSPERDVKATAGGNSLPAKPSQTAELSYSAQVAKQFSVYKQTPAQERQQRTQSASSSTSKAHIASIDSMDTATHDSNRNRTVRPSEMKDEG